jgi:hypothetical protein
VTSGVEQVNPASIQIGDRIQHASGTGSITVARIRSAVIERQAGDTRDATTVFEFEDGEEGEVVWTFRETELVTRQVIRGS